MRKISLLQQDIDILLTIEDKYKKRDYIQNLGLEIFRKNKGQLLCTWATSLGKTVLAIKIIEFLRTKSDQVIHITVPTDNLKKQWESKLENIENVIVFTIHSYCKLENPCPLLLIVDEAHIGVANEDAIEFNKIVKFNPIFRLFLSATLKAKQKTLLSRNGIKTEFNININQAQLLKFVPSFIIKNVLIPFTKQEEIEYALNLKKEERLKTFFAYHGFYKKINPKGKFPVFLDDQGNNITKQAKINNINWFRSTAKRVGLVSKSHNKLKLLEEVITDLNKKTLIFTTSKERASLIKKFDPKNIALYVSGNKKQSEKELNLFYTNEKHISVSVNKLIAGYDDESAECIIRDGYFSSENSTVQSLGRILRVDPNNPDKSPVMYNFLIKEYMYGKEKIIPCDNYWLSIGMKGLKKETITIEEFKKEIKN